MKRWRTQETAMKHTYSKLSSRLWVGDANVAESLFTRHANPPDGIKSIICPAIDCVALRGIVYHRHLHVMMLPWPDGQVISRATHQALLAFFDAFYPTFVHCAAGANRSLAIAALLLVHEGKSLEDAFKLAEPWHPTIWQSVVDLVGAK